MKYVYLLAVVVILSGFSTVLGQATETATGVAIDKDLALLRRDLRSEKKQIIAMNLPLTETEATAFWPVYDKYVDEMRKVNDEFYAVIKDYAQNQKTLTDTQAVSMVQRWADLQVKQAETRQKYVAQFAKVIAGKKAALFLQIDRRLYMLMDLQTASEVTLVLQDK
jgi:hypothetical protein